jgi:hypothetical protein
MKTIRLISVFVLLVLPIFCNAKPITFIPFDNDTIKYDGKGKWMDRHDYLVLKHMKVIYTRPADFKEVSGSECFETYPKLKKLITCAGNQLHSNDEQFIAFIPIYKPFTKEDSIDMKRYFPNMPFDVIDKQYIIQIKNNITTSLGKEKGENWRKHVKFYSAGEAKRLCNADTIIRYSVKLQPQDYYKGKYKYLDVLFLQKKGRGFVNFYCFYTDKGKMKFASYWKAMEGVFRYED